MKKTHFLGAELVVLTLILSPSLTFAEKEIETLNTLDITAKLSDFDKVKHLDSQRAYSSEGVQVITGDYIKAQQASTFADALRKTTSVQVDEEAGQQGNLIFIRGFTQDQVSVRVEGAPKNFNQVRHGGAGTVWLEPNMYNNISVIPGVTSNVYGNGSLGGVILLETKDPKDIIKDGRDWGMNVRGGFETNGQSIFTSIDAAKQLNDELSLSATFVTRNTDQYKDGHGQKALMGATGTDDINVMLKSVYKIDEAQSFELSYVGLKKNYTARTTTGSGKYTSPSETEVRDDTYSIQYQLNPLDNELVDLNVRFSQTNIERNRLTIGKTKPAIWGVDTSYFEVENRSVLFQGDQITHRLRYGLDYTYDDVLTAYYSSQDSDSPVKRKRAQMGLYISDSMLIGDSLELVLSTRLDRFKNSSDLGQSINETGVSPKVAFNWSPFSEGVVEGLSVYGVVGKGFRSPSTHEAFGRGDGLPSCGRRGCSETRPNPSLKGETSDSWEAGIRYQRENLFTNNDQFNIQLGYVKNEVDDFISNILINEYTTDLDGDGRPDNIDVYQFQNINSASIDGVEISVNYTNDDWFAALTAQNIDGIDDKGAKLPEISPASMNLSLGGYAFDGKSRFGVDISSRKEREFFQRRSLRRRQGYTIVDVFGSYQITPALGLQLRVENIANKRFSKRKIVNIKGEDLTTYAPGRNVKMTLEYQF